jgi:hypothetical protein
MGPSPAKSRADGEHSGPDTAAVVLLRGAHRQETDIAAQTGECDDGPVTTQEMTGWMRDCLDRDKTGC